LMFAHAHGVIHRDVKPGNILLESGHAILADFGLAKAVSGAGDQALTRTGFAVGTPAYTSPEQAVGDEVVDGRADLYSLGCVLYEMLAGQPPFVGPTSDSVVRLHMTADPASVRIMRPGIPEEVEEILDRLLAKSPADRFSSAEELLRILDAAISGEFPLGRITPRGRGRRSGGGPGWLGRSWRRFVLPLSAVVVLAVVGVPWLLDRMGTARSVDSGLFDRSDLAVLYFDDLSRDGDFQYVADGFTEGLINEFTRVSGLTVVSRNGVAPFRGSTAPLDSIAAALEVGTLIGGSVEPIEERLRISINLVEGYSGSSFLRRTFDIPARELLLAQDSLIREVGLMLRERLGEEVRLRRRQAGTTSTDAWALVQRGEIDRKQAEELFQQGETDGAFAAFARADSLLSLAEVADPEWVEPIQMRGWIAYRESREAGEMENVLDGIHRGLSHAARALAIDPNCAQALELRGTIRYWHWLLAVTPDPDEDAALLAGAQEDLESATSIDRTLASAFGPLSHLHYQVSDLTSALVAARTAYETDVYHQSAASVLWRLFAASYDTERFTQARWACNEGHHRFPTDFQFSRCRILDMTLPGGTPDPAESWVIQEQTVALAPEARRGYEESLTRIFVAEVLAQANLPDSARSVLLGARVGADVDPARELPYLEAHVRTVLGDYDEAVALLRTLFAG
ncbi:MAG: serine/threonine-protein kinase, partial [Longimicrobiales bacterium]|nr:serine/threonine-protein kinase [Longimicrobiales bacterium]